MASKIEWLNGGETWNPIRAEVLEDIRDEQGRVVIPKGTIGWFCTKKSPGCAGCYAEAMNLWRGNRLKYIVGNLNKVRILLDEEVLLKPLHWKKPRLIFPCSMTDWMEKYVPDEFRDKMLAVMALTPQHTYLTLTKCADRQRDYFTQLRRDGDCSGLARLAHGRPARFFPSEFKRLPLNNSAPFIWPLPNLWLGVSAEDQKYADERIPLLLQTPAAVRWVSAEPLLGPINLHNFLIKPMNIPDCMSGDGPYECGSKLDWGVIGLESGIKARPGNIGWIRHLLWQFKSAGVPVFVKQLGAVPVIDEKQWRSTSPIALLAAKNRNKSPEGTVPLKFNDAKGGDPSEWPEDLRVREYPKAGANA